MYKVLLISNHINRSHRLTDALQTLGYQSIMRLEASQCLLTGVQQDQPDIILIDLPSFDRATLELLNHLISCYVKWRWIDPNQLHASTT